jgi:hypothetical protein
MVHTSCFDRPRRSAWRWASLAMLLAIVAGGCSSPGTRASPTAAPPPAQTGPAAALTASAQAGGVASLTGPVDGIPCELTERLLYHVHAHLAIIANGQPVAVPANIGIPGRCIYWLHTHDTTGVIHIEAPAPRAFDLGTFFDIWRQPLTASQVLDFTADAGHSLQFFVDGQPYSGDPRQIQLGAHTLVTIEYGPPFAAPPPFTFPPGL